MNDNTYHLNAVAFAWSKVVQGQINAFVGFMTNSRRHRFEALSEVT